VELAPGEARTVQLRLTPAKLGQYLADGRFVVQPGTFRVMVGSSSRDADLKSTALDVGIR
jgi:beta-glucosidase